MSDTDENTSQDERIKELLAQNYRLAEENNQYAARVAELEKNLDCGQVIFDESLKGMDRFHTDIRAMKELEEKLKVLTIAIEHAPVSFIITDKEGNIEYVNPHFTKISGYTLPEVLGQNPRILKSGFTSMEEYRLLWDEISHEHSWRGMFKNLKKSGKSYWELATILPIKDDKGGIAHYLGIKEEITEAKHLQEQLIQKDADIHNLATILEEAKIEIYIFEKLTLHFHYANKSALLNTGYTYEEILSLTPVELTKANPEILTEQINRIDAEGRVIFEIMNYRKDGSSYPVNVVLQHSYYNECDVYVAMVTDITQQKQMSEEIHKTQEIMIAQSRHAAMGEMIGMIAHQWRQPLSIISMIINNMIMDIELDALNVRACETTGENVLAQVSYLSKTIDDFRDFFRPDKQRESVKIVDIFKEAHSIMEASLLNNNISVEISNQCKTSIYTYSRELLQVFINILKNAKEALEMCPDTNRRIHVCIVEDKDFVTAHLCNNGNLILPEVLPHIFDPYFSTKDEKIGTGLGLYMSKTIVEKHLKGSISAENRGDEVCFTVWIPNGKPLDGQNETD